jgi:hypothetical protein
MKMKGILKKDLYHSLISTMAIVAMQNKRFGEIRAVIHDVQNEKITEIEALRKINDIIHKPIGDLDEEIARARDQLEKECKTKR